MKIVSVILARGGSKEIPKKNIKLLCGKPLIQYSIEASNRSLSSETWVSTDCKEIKKISLDLGAKVLDRPKSLSEDDSKSDDALIHFVQNVSCDVVIMIQPTSPFITSNYINQGIIMMRNHDSVFSGYKKHWIPEWHQKDQSLKPFNWDIKNRPMRQDVEFTVVENGAFYITTCYNLINSVVRSSGAVGFVEMLEEESLQIDSLNDFRFAEKLINLR